MKRFVFGPHRKTFQYVVAAAVILTLSACSQNLVFDNEYDPEADNSPLGRSINDLFTIPYMDSVDEKSVDFGWNRVPEALSYEYQIVQLYWRDETGDFAFDRVATGGRGLSAEGTLGQTIEGENPNDTVNLQDGVYAIRVRYEATATHVGFFSDVWSPWSILEEREIGVPRYYWRTDDLSRSDQFEGRFDFRGDRYIFQVDFTGQGAAGNTMFLYIDDEYSGYENGADPYISVYDADNSFDGSFLEGGFRFNKMESPIVFTMPPSERLYIMLESENPDDTFFEIRIEY